MDVYENYELDGVYVWGLSEKDILVLDIAIYIVDNACTIRQVAKEFLVSKSTVHRYIHERLQTLSFELYQCVIKRLRLNKQRYFR